MNQAKEKQATTLAIFFGKEWKDQFLIKSKKQKKSP